MTRWAVRTIWKFFKVFGAVLVLLWLALVLLWVTLVKGAAALWCYMAHREEIEEMQYRMRRCCKCGRMWMENG